MFVLQEFLRKQLIDPAYASEIMEGILQECVTYSQHDMAHLLFRAFLRFRKYGCTISVDALRFLFESYRDNDSSELMLQLANEMRGDAALRPLCIAAYLFANKEAEANALMDGLSFADLGTDDWLALVAGYEKLGDDKKLEDIVDKVQQRIPSQEAQSNVCAALLRVFAKRDNDAAFTRVLKTVTDAGVPLRPGMFATVLRQKMRRVASVEEMAAVEDELKEMGYTPDVTGNSIIITAYARLYHFGDRGSEELMLSKVDTLLSSIESRLRQDDPDMEIGAAHIRAVIRGYGVAGRSDAIKDAWARLRDKPLTQDVRIYNELFKWLALMGNVKDVLSLREEMRQNGVNPDSLTYTWMLRALGKYYPRHASQIYEEINDRHVRPDLQLYNTLIGTFGDLQQFDRVEAVFAEMKKREESGTLQFSSITFAVLIRVYSRDLSKAESLYEEARQRNLADHPHVQTSMLHAYATTVSRTSRWSKQHRQRGAPTTAEASTGVSEVQEGGVGHASAGVTPSEDERDATRRMDTFLASLSSWDTDTYNVLLHLYGKQHDVARFEHTLAKMRKEQVAMNDVTFGTLITVFAHWGEAGKVDEMIQLLKESAGEVSAAFYSVLASSLNRLGNTVGVTDAWDDLIASKLFPNTKVYNQFLTLYSRQHDMGKMQGVLNSMMKQVPPNPVTATTVLDLLGKSGRIAEMESLFQDMKTTPDTQPTSVTFHQVMNAYAKSGDAAKMEQTHEEFLKQGYTSDHVTYNILMDGYGRAKGFRQMEETLQKRVAEGVPMDDIAYCILLTTYGKARMEQDVVRLFNEVTEPANAAFLTKRVLWSCVDAFCRCGDSERMENAIALLRAADGDGALATKDQSAFIPYYCRLGLMDKVEALETEMTKTGGGECLSYSALNSVARGYARVGRFDKVVETLHRLRDNHWVPDPSTALQLSAAFLKAGLHEQAKQIIEWRRQYVKTAGGGAVGASDMADVEGFRE